MHLNQVTTNQKNFKSKQKAFSKSKEYLELLLLITNSEHNESALIKKSGEVLNNLYKILTPEELGVLGELVQANVEKNPELKKAYQLSCLDAIDSYRHHSGLVSFKLLPVYIKTRSALSQLHLRPGLGELRLLANLTNNLQSPCSEKAGWVTILPQLIHQSSLVEVDLSLLVLIKHIVLKIKDKTPITPPITFPLQCREIGISDKNSNLYFIPLIHFEPTPSTDTFQEGTPPDWDKTARFVDNWLMECGYPPASSDAECRFQHGQNPVPASAVLGSAY